MAPKERGTDAKKRPAGGPKKQQGGGEKGAMVFVVAIAALSVLLYHFRGQILSGVLPRYLERTKNAKNPGGEFEVLGWANWMEKITTSDDNARCCYTPEFASLYQSFCESDLDFMDDGVKIIGACSLNLRGRTEMPIKQFNTEHYSGQVTQSSKGPGNVFMVKEVKKVKSKKDAGKPVEPAKDGDAKNACLILKHCSDPKNKVDKPCREIRKMLGDCWN